MGLLSSRPKAQPPAAPAPTKAKIAHLAAKATAPDARFEKPYAKSPVRNSPELERILNLPRRALPTEADLASMRAEMTALLSNGVPAGQCYCKKLNPNENCITELRDVQAWYFYEARLVGGVLGIIQVGGGKTGIGALTAMVVPDCREAVLLLPPGLKEQFLKDFRRWAQHFKVPNIAGGPGAGPNGEFLPGRPVLHVLKYSELSSPGFARWFDARPNISVVICDEAHALKAVGATRTKRFLANAEARPNTRYFLHTGSLTSKAIQEYTHLSALALGPGSPVPIDPHVVSVWGEALNPPRHGDPAPPGALMRLCEPGENVYQGFARRLLETAGVVSSMEGALAGVELVIKQRKPPEMPPELRDALRQVRETMTRPDGEELTDAFEVARCVRELCAGYYNYWAYPGSKPEDFEPGGRIDNWFQKRQDWNRAVRDRLKTHVLEMDSEGLLKAAAKRALGGYTGLRPIWHEESAAPWFEVEKTVPHETRVKFVSDWLARDAADWGHANAGIIWVEGPELGRLIARLGGFVYYGEGAEAAAGIDAEKGDKTIVASIRAHGTGRNLQYSFHRNLFVQVPADAGVWQQTVGRTHRPGQESPVVYVEVYLHAPELQEAFDLATRRAGYAGGTTRGDHKLLSATREFSRSSDM